MARKEIGNSLDRENRNNHNDNYEELYRKITDVGSEIDNLVLHSGGDSNLEVVQARADEKGKIHPTLKRRIDESFSEVTSQLNDTNSQLAHKAQEIAHLENNKMDKDTTNISPAQINKNLGKFDETYLTDELLQQMAGNTPINSTPAPKSVTTVKLADRSITPRETDFMNLSTNLINENTVTPNKNVDASGNIIDSVSYSLSDYIPIVPNTVYSSKNVEFKSYFDADKQFISRTYNEETFTTPENAYFVRAACIPTRFGVSAQINLGSTLLPFEKYYAYLDTDHIKPLSIPVDNLLPDNSIDLKKLGFLKYSDNLYNKATTKLNRVVNAAGVENDSSSNALSDYIKVSPNTTYTLAKAWSTAFYTVDKVFISRPDNEGTFTTPANAYYVRLIMHNNNYDKVQINLGDTLLPYEDYYVWFNDELKDPNGNKSSNNEEKTYYFAPEEITGVFKLPSGSYPKFSTSNDVINAFRTLAAANTDYITETLMGNDSSGTYPIYQYTLKTPHVEATDLTKKLPKVLLVSGLHGGEVSSVFSSYYLFKLLCENWENDPLLEYLRCNVEIVCIPYASPYAYDNPAETNIGRWNANGVDLNRNFSVGWTQGTVGSATYGGTAPFSEVETQYVKSMIDANTDAIYFGDYHTNGSTAAGTDYSLLMWHSLINGEYYNENVTISSRYLIEKLTREFRRDYGLTEKGHYGYISFSNVGGTAKLYGASKGIPSSTFECFMKFPNEMEFSSETNIKACTEYVGNWILTLIKQLKTVY